MEHQPIRRGAKPYARWSVDTERAFLLALKASGQVTKALAEIGRSKAAAYARRKRDPDFARAWDDAVAAGQAEWAADCAAQQGPADDGAGSGRLGRARERADGWDARRRGAFLKALNDSKDVRAACAAAGMSSTSAYALRGRSPAFAKAWEKALADAAPSVLDAARERAIHGWTEPIIAGGKVIGERRRYSDSLLKSLVDREGRAEEEAKEPPKPRSRKERVARAEAAAEEAGGSFIEKRVSRADAEARLHRQLDAMERQLQREERVQHAADWERWQADWQKWGRQRPRPLLLADLRAGAPGVRVLTSD